MLIGIDHPKLHVSLQECRGPTGCPVARLGPLGWSYVGPLSAQPAKSQAMLSVCCEVDKSVRRLWEIDEISTAYRPRDILTIDDKLALETVR